MADTTQKFIMTDFVETHMNRKKKVTLGGLEMESERLLEREVDLRVVHIAESEGIASVWTIFCMKTRLVNTTGVDATSLSSSLETSEQKYWLDWMQWQWVRDSFVITILHYFCLIPCFPVTGHRLDSVGSAREFIGFVFGPKLKTLSKLIISGK